MDVEVWLLLNTEDPLSAPCELEVLHFNKVPVLPSAGGMSRLEHQIISDASNISMTVHTNRMKHHPNTRKARIKCVLNNLILNTASLIKASYYTS